MNRVERTNERMVVRSLNHHCKLPSKKRVLHVIKGRREGDRGRRKATAGEGRVGKLQWMMTDTDDVVSDDFSHVKWSRA